MQALQQSALFALHHQTTSIDEKTALAYKRAKLILQAYNFTAHDILTFSQKFWDMHFDPVLPLDWGAATIIAAHLNLTVGTIARFLPQRPELEPLVQSLLRLDTVGVYLLTERGHGLDAFNLETTATKMGDHFVMHCPREEAYKFMPATTPMFGIPKVACVAARLMVDGQDRGCRFFLVPICTATGMYPGVTSIRLPHRSGTSPLDFSMTVFDHVQLPLSALLDTTMDAPSDRKADWWKQVWRIPLGTAAVAAPCLKGLQHVCFIGARYSIDRHVFSHSTVPKPIPIISFPTQQWPILHAVAVGTVLEAWYKQLIHIFSDPSLDLQVRHGLSVLVKTTVIRQVGPCTHAVSERCGAQGMIENNFMAKFEMDVRGTVIAEGDILALCIRTWPELVLQRYTLPMPPATDSLPAQLAHSLLAEYVDGIKTLPGGHRGPLSESYLLPAAERGIIAIGHACAYAAARNAGVPRPLLDVYECGVMRGYAAWFSEMAGITHQAQMQREVDALQAALPGLEEYIEKFGVKDAVRAAIVDERTWKESVVQMETFRPAPDADLGDVQTASDNGNSARAKL